MSSVDLFIQGLDDPQRSLMIYLDHLLMQIPELTSKIRYRIPFYYRKSWICYLNPIKRQGIELVFIRGNELSNEQGILDPKGRKQVSGLEIYRSNDIPFTALHEVIQEALILDESVPYASKRSSI